MFKSIIKVKGFGLIEATISIALLTIGLFSIIQFFPFSIEIVGDSQNLTTASAIALSKSEEIISLDYDDVTTGTYEVKQPVSTDTDSYLSHYQREVIVETVDGDLNTSGSDLGLKIVTITVYWLSSIGTVERSTQIQSLIANY